MGGRYSGGGKQGGNKEPKAENYGKFVTPWVAPPYKPFKYYGGEYDDDVPLFVNKDLNEIDLTSYLAPLSDNKDAVFKYPLKVDLDNEESP